MNAPLIWIVLPLIVSIVLVFVRRNYQLAALIQTVFCLVMVFLLQITHIGENEINQAFSFSLNPTFNFLGRSLVLNNSDKFIIGIFYVVLAGWSVVLYLNNKQSKIVPLGLLLTSLLLAAIAVDPFLYSALIIEVAVIISNMIAVDPRTGKSKGILRSLIFFTLGMLFILLSGWFLAGGETSPVNDEQLIQATVLLGLGFVFWLAVFPFHSWIPLIAEESEIEDGSYILGILPFSILVILLKYLNGFVWLRDYELVYQALILFGIIMVSTGAVWSIFQTRLKKIIGYLVITYTGFILVALGLNTNQGYLIFSELLLPRFLCIFLAMVSLLKIEKEEQIDDIDSLLSVFYRFPIASIGLLVSFFSIIGMPLTVGFLPISSLYQAASINYMPITGIMLGSNALLSISFMRLLILIIHSPSDDFEPISIKEDLKNNIFLATLVVFTVIVGLIPNILFPSFNQILKSFEFLVK